MNLPKYEFFAEWTVTRDEVRLHVYQGSTYIGWLPLDISNSIFGGGNPSDELGGLIMSLRTHEFPEPTISKNSPLR